jgi:hypothetical protein
MGLRFVNRKSFVSNTANHIWLLFSSRKLNERLKIFFLLYSSQQQTPTQILLINWKILWNDGAMIVFVR